MKKMKKRLPSGKTVIRKIREMTSHAACANCGKVLHGMPRGVTSTVRRFAKSELKVNRAYGGHYCSECSRELFREKARQLQ